MFIAMSRRGWFAAIGSFAISLALQSTPAAALCGFYVGKADAKLFNEASQVIVARDGIAP
jgi:hypothetical protein